MMNKKKLGIAAILISLVTAGAVGVASAQGSDRDARADRKAELLKKFDTNGDGVLDASEKQAMRVAMKEKREARKAEMLAKYDTNKDGKLDASERAVMRDDLAAKEFAKLDKDGDGKLSLDEFKAGMKERGFAFGRFGHRHGHRFARKANETK
jgi:Ca2+-binding EF-hand superfamily protein